jgi:hypothetical protein
VRTCWVVSISDVGYADGDDYLSGPYSEARARAIVRAFNQRRSEYGWHATTFPLGRHTIPELVGLHDPQTAVLF